MKIYIYILISIAMSVSQSALALPPVTLTPPPSTPTAEPPTPSLTATPWQESPTLTGTITLPPTETPTPTTSASTTITPTGTTTATTTPTGTSPPYTTTPTNTPAGPIQLCINDKWHFQETFNVVGLGSTSFNDGNISLPHITYTLVSEVMHTQPRRGFSYDCYKFSWNTTGYFAGSMQLTSSYIYLRSDPNGLAYSGNMWLRKSDLAVVTRERHVGGIMEADYGYGWYPIANFNANMMEEYGPPMQYFQWPLTVGNNWPANSSVWVYGDYNVPFMGHSNFDFVMPWYYNFSIARYGQFFGRDAYEVVGTANFPDRASQTVYYAPSVRFYNRQEWRQIDFPSFFFTLSEAIFTLFKFDPCDSTPTPTPTNTPTPSNTPTPTDTPVPTHTPTLSPSPTESPSPSPTPTQTATITPTPSPTETPTGPVRPFIILGGYWDTVLTGVAGGKLKWMAITTDPQNNVSEVEVQYQGQPTGLVLYDDGFHSDVGPGDGVWGNMLLVPPPGGGGRLLLELNVKDATGYKGLQWPYLDVQ